MRSYWITFEDGSKGCCDGQTAGDAQFIAEHFTGKTVKDSDQYKYKADENPNIKPLPYPANPNIWLFEHPVHGKMPCFCFRPNECAGHGSCQSGRSCVD